MVQTIKNNTDNFKEKGKTIKNTIKQKNANNFAAVTIIAFL